MVVRQLQFIVFSMFFMVLIGATPVFAGPQTDASSVTFPEPRTLPGTSTCDAGFYKAMSNRAWMEGQREMEVAQRLILKPDSVLEYSCFNKIIEANAQGTGFTPTSNGMNALIWPALNSYLEENFPHTLGGGKYEDGVQGTCDAMSRIWEFLRCSNFDKEDFGTFVVPQRNSDGSVRVVDGQIQYEINHDRRTLPAMCNSPNRGDNWFKAIQAANPLPLDEPKDGGAARKNTYFDILDPTQCAAAKVVPTGLMMVQTYPDETTSLSGETQTVTRRKEYTDAVCSAPGCSLDPGGNNTPRCVAVGAASTNP